jgi:hypothetical protein
MGYYLLAILLIYLLFALSINGNFGKYSWLLARRLFPLGLSMQINIFLGS